MSRAENSRSLQRLIIPELGVVLGGVLLLLFPPVYPLLWIRLILGLFSFIFTPGYVFVTRFLQLSSKIVIGYAFIVGFLIQSMNLYILWSLAIRSFNFYLVTILLTMLEILLFTRLGQQLKSKTCGDGHNFTASRFFSPAWLAFIAGLTINVFNRIQIEEPTTDLALYLLNAKSIVEKGAFSVPILNVYSQPNALLLGYSTFHLVTVFTISVFFLISDVSFLTAKLGFSLIAALTIFPTYEISAKLFGERAAIFASFLVAVNPLITSTLVSGVQIIGGLFMLTALSLLIEGIQDARREFMLVSGLVASAALLAWNVEGVLLLAEVPFLLVLLCPKRRIDTLIRSFSTSLMLSAITIVTIYFLHFYAIELFLLVCFITVAAIASRRGCYHVKMTSVFYFPLITIINFHQIRSIFLPEILQILPQSVGQRVNQGVESALAGFGAGFFAYASHYLDVFTNYVGIFFILLAAPAFFIRTKLKQIGCIFLYLLLHFTVVGDIAYPIYTYMDGYRFFYTPTVMIVTLSSLTLASLTRFIRFRILFHNCRKSSRHAVLSSNVGFRILVSILLLVVVILASIPKYTTYIAVENTYLNILNPNNGNWGPAIQWINQNIPNDSVLMSRKPYELAWYTGRSVVGVYGITDFPSLISSVKKYGVDYLIVDYSFYQSLPALQVLYTMPEQQHISLGNGIYVSIPKPIYESINNVTGRNVFIYNAREITLATSSIG